jgi:hypothetical protein
MGREGRVYIGSENCFGNTDTIGRGPDVWFFQILCIDELLNWRIALIGC